MSASAEKGNRKREIEQLPIKKKFKDSTISREDLDDAIANGVKLALKEQQSTLNLAMASAVRDAVDSVLIPALRELREDIQATNKSVKELREELEAIATTAKQTRDRVDSVQADAREDRRIEAEETTFDWWGCQRGRVAQAWLVSSELIFPNGFRR